MNECILLIVKPDGMVKGLAGHILRRFEETDLRLVGARLAKVDRDLAATHYHHLREKPFFDELIRFITGELHGAQDTVLAFAYTGENAVKKARAIAGATNPEEADYRSIRGSFGRVTTKGVFENVVHVSSDAIEGEREIKLWFRPEEITTDLFPAVAADGRLEWAAPAGPKTRTGPWPAE
ncbi:MAG: nucleoside-diphosphate kinase [Elusimicrobia bacterium]|nr:MAG: nucleoside-diphosphate kinase [Elusimicrobiota bacterium]KAF0153900.1 MAG: nucleoside-diphosphate kinase [Elusimicrobiota bacterium]